MTMKFKFYVLNYNHNKNVVEMFNIFQNVHVQQRTESAIKKYLRSPKKFKILDNNKNELYGFDALVKEIDEVIAWQELSRFEYECSCGYAFETDCNKLQKVDCYYQAHANIETIVHDAIRQYKEQLKKEVRIE